VSSFRLRSGKSTLVFILCLAGASRLWAQGDQQIYTDSLQNGWQNWGWAQINYANTSPVHSGAKSISVTFTTNTYEAIYIEHPDFDSSGYSNLTFWINGGASGGQTLKVQALLGNSAQPAVNLAPLTTSWQQITISLASLGVVNQPNLDGFWIQDRIGAAQPAFFVDDITLTAGTIAPPTTVQINVDAQKNRHAISPLIYGVAFATGSELADMNCTINRSGGNAETRYNWQIDAHNRGSDWYFESIADSNPLIVGGSGDSFVQDTLSGHAQPILTVSMIGWVAKLGSNRDKLASYSISKYGPQTGDDSAYYPDAGNGVGTNAALHTSWLITTNVMTDANVQINSAYERGWIQHLTNQWGLSTNGGVRYYCMDNEHSIWQGTHRDVHPIGPTMQEMRDKFFDYGAAVKAIDPGAQLLFPEEWGWNGYFDSGYDQQWAGDHGDYNAADYPDRKTNGGWDYIPWLLDQARQQAATNNNRRLLDYLTVHWYPQSGEFGQDTSPTMELLRNRSTRSLWDSNYVDASWVGSVVALIPRLKTWVANYYPGTKVGITEYSWGAENNINGATAEADILGIFGREGLDLATRWTVPPAGSDAYNAFKMYRNYDGANSTFGDTSVLATAPNPDNVSTFAAVRSSDGALTLMVINKQLSTAQPVSINLANFPSAGVAHAWRLTSADVITNLADISVKGNTITNTLPAQSVTLLVVPSAANQPALQSGTLSAGAFDFWLTGQPGQYIIQTSTDLAHWTSVQTNALTSGTLHCTVPAPNSGPAFYRAVCAQ